MLASPAMPKSNSRFCQSVPQPPSVDDSNKLSNDKRSKQVNDKPTNNNRSPQFYKTRMCPWYFKQCCDLGSRCRFAHSVEELRRPPDLSRTSLCHRLLKEGVCLKPNCSYAHNHSELRATDDFFKVSICYMWQKGRCTLGAKCRHAHGMQELRVPVGAAAQFPAPPVAPLPPTSWSESETSVDGWDDNKIWQDSSVLTDHYSDAFSTAPSTACGMEFPHTAFNSLASPLSYGHYESSSICDNSTTCSSASPQQSSALPSSLASSPLTQPSLVPLEPAPPVDLVSNMAQLLQQDFTSTEATPATTDDLSALLLLCSLLGNTNQQAEAPCDSELSPYAPPKPLYCGATEAPAAVIGSAEKLPAVTSSGWPWTPFIEEPFSTIFSGPSTDFSASQQSTSSLSPRLDNNEHLVAGFESYPSPRSHH
eukprot:Blabericola_migrator_1__7250@NODE_3681_length_1580_cov_303_142102_g2283_i0_p1_GENE_NODE_3681_length_1580_cov_303_142102_g2283_i0NODE_3681_length_1580_cov_303_142102_g2283_i0_p1_ORF_typecomplete_len422_score46_86zfCCCH/PF00642_24/0_0014zfCCCH/PF00642_24/18zfCCCH/PF00642_24/4_1e05zfCCCH_3/PF15663_5/1_5e05zfCCCH_3/PF15663_5/0_096Torus/PF16131_5/0_0043Torus/PF16131_5/2e03Torus/PF16131_5/0_017zfCCCH_4/PF18044_1/5zfCCCH_4/PF18044_1/1_7e03zfCCCH_4/PF18044_1/0_011zf_CCCH_4/PF18345_1/27zf_CCCH_4/PF18345_